MLASCTDDHCLAGSRVITTAASQHCLMLSALCEWQVISQLERELVLASWVLKSLRGSENVTE